MKYTYLLVNFFSIIIPFLFSYHPKLRFDKHFSAFFKANMITAILFLIWDAAFTAKGVWSFNDHYTIGWKIFNLPIEEILFFICIPFACLFTIHCMNLFFRLRWKARTENLFVLFFGTLLLITGLYHIEKLYTSWTFISTALMLFLFKYYFKVEWLSNFIMIYSVLLIPFFIVNGILTGTGPDQAVVSYNNNENLGIRLLTIPLEDIIYGLELLMLNLFFYYRFSNNGEAKGALIK